MRIHEYLEIVAKSDGRKMIVCRKCGFEFCESKRNYKDFALLRERDWSDLPRRSTVAGKTSLIVYQEFICPGCATLLQTDPFCKEIDAENPVLWDIQVTA